MTEMNVNARWRDNLYDVEDSEKTKKGEKVKQQHGPQAPQGLGATDTTEATQGNYQEDYVAPADKAQLEKSDPNASKTVNVPTKQSPDGAFQKSFNEALSHLSIHEFNKFDTLQGMPREKVIAMVKYAQSHPNDKNVDSAVKTILTSISKYAEAKTENEYGLSSEWKPPVPDEAAADQQISQTYEKNFESTLREQLTKKGFSGEKLEKLVNEFKLAHFHPEEKPLTEKQQAFLKQVEQKATNMTKAQTGFPKGYQIQKDSSLYDAKLSVSYDRNFDQALEKFAEENGLTGKEKAALETLHYDPEAQVPNKENLKGTLQLLNKQALQGTQQEFNLPEEFSPTPSVSYRNAVLQGEYKREFINNVKSFKPPLTLAQQQMLIATGGLSASNLPPELKALFEDIKNMTADQIQERFGLPSTWGPKNGKLPSISENGAEEAEQTGESEEASGETEAGPAAGSETKKAGKVGEPTINGVGGGAGIKTKGASAEQVGNEAGIDTEMAHKLLNHNEAILKAAARLSEDYLSGGDAILIKDFMLAVSQALSTLRFGIYAIMAADARCMTKISQMDKETKIEKIKAQQQKIEEARDKGKVMPWEAIAVILVVVSAAVMFVFPPAMLLTQTFIATHATSDLMDKLGIDLGAINQLLEEANKATDAASKTFLWAADILLGGLLSAMTQLMKFQAISENPMVTLGILSPEQAQWVDLALQIVAMVIEMIICTLLAQPELVMALVALKSMTLSVELAVAVVKVVVQILIATVKEMVMGVVNAVKSVLQAIARAARTAAEFTAKAATAVGQTLMEVRAVRSVVNAVKSVLRSIYKAARTAAEFVSEAASKAKEAVVQLRSSKNSVEGVEGGAKGGTRSTEAGEKAGLSKGTELDTGKPKVDTKIKAQKATTVDTRVSNGEKTLETQKQSIQKAEEEAIEGLRKMKKGFDKAEFEQIKKMCAQLNEYFQIYLYSKDLAGMVIRTAQNVVNFFNEMRLAKIALENAELEGSIKMADASEKEFEKARQAVLVCLDEGGKWVGQVNKQQANYWQKAHITYSG